MAEAVDLVRFHDGHRWTLEQVYREHLPRVERAVAAVLSGMDAESVVQEVFLRLLSSGDLRRQFHGGNLGAWLVTVARNQALDHLKHLQRRGRNEANAYSTDPVGRSFEDEHEAKALIETFKAEHVPPQWAQVFELRFLQQLSQDETAAALGIARTTLAYQELRLRMRLKRFLLRER
jgi:RNA polymerase sigma-70 factor (ECF subfamily)